MISRFAGRADECHGESVAPAASMTPRAKLVVALAVVGAIPLTTGVLIWAIGSVMGIGFHGGWNGVAGTGRIIALAGLLPGLVMIVLAASGRREMMRARPRPRPVPAGTQPPARGPRAPGLPGGPTAAGTGSTIKHGLPVTSGTAAGRARCAAR